MVKKMKQNFKTFIIAVILGLGICYLVNTKFDKTILTKALESKVSYFYLGSYNDLTKAESKKASFENSIIYNDKGIYKVVIGVYGNKDAKELMRSYFDSQNINFYEDTMRINNEFLKQSEAYELLIKTSDYSYYENINNSLLNLFNEYIS